MIRPPHRQARRMLLVPEHQPKLTCSRFTNRDRTIRLSLRPRGTPPSPRRGCRLLRRWDRPSTPSRLAPVRALWSRPTDPSPSGFVPASQARRCPRPSPCRRGTILRGNAAAAFASSMGFPVLGLTTSVAISLCGRTTPARTDTMRRCSLVGMNGGRPAPERAPRLFFRPPGRIFNSLCP